MIKIIFTISLFLLPISTRNLANDEVKSHKTFLKIVEYNFMEWSMELYKEIDENELNIEVLRKALKGYLKLSNKNEIENPEIISIIDFSKSANKKRLFINVTNQCFVHR